MQNGRCGQADPFPAESGKRSPPSQTIWIHHHKPSLWGTTGRKENLTQLYREIGESYERLDKWSMYLITSYEKAENDIGRKADKNRKIYNGMLKTYYYQFLGPRPPKKNRN